MIRRRRAGGWDEARRGTRWTPSGATPESGQPSSDAAITWFRLSDRGPPQRTLSAPPAGRGATLTSITAETWRHRDVGVTVLPMTDGVVSTHLVRRRVELAFQDYFVRLHHDVEVDGRIDTHDRVRPPR